MKESGSELMKKRIIAALLLALSTAAPFAAAAEEEISVDAIAIEDGDYAVIQDLDENGLPVKETFYGLDGNVMAVDGYTSASLIYNQKGQLIRKPALTNQMNGSSPKKDMWFVHMIMIQPEILCRNVSTAWRVRLSL